MAGRAREILSLMEAGQHPRAVIKAQRRERAVHEAVAARSAANSLVTVRERYFAERASRKLRPTTLRKYKFVLHLAEFKAWKSRPFDSITIDDADELLKKIERNHPARVKGGEGCTANNVQRCASAM